MSLPSAKLSALCFSYSSRRAFSVAAMFCMRALWSALMMTQGGDVLEAEIYRGD